MRCRCGHLDGAHFDEVGVCGGCLCERFRPLPDPLTVPCPECGSAVGVPCSRPAGGLGRTPVRWLHVDRLLANRNYLA